MNINKFIMFKTKNSFKASLIFMVKTLDPSPSKTYSISLFRGSSIMTLVRDGVKTEPIACGLLACSLIFDEVGLTLENLGV
jgi:hypothetical protein